MWYMPCLCGAWCMRCLAPHEVVTAWSGICYGAACHFGRSGAVAGQEQGGSSWGAGRATRLLAMWTMWTLWTAILGFRVHSVHPVHFVHSSAAFGALREGGRASRRLTPPATFCRRFAAGRRMGLAATSAQTSPPPTQGRWGARGGCRPAVGGGGGAIGDPLPPLRGCSAPMPTRLAVPRNRVAVTGGRHRAHSSPARAARPPLAAGGRWLLRGAPAARSHHPPDPSAERCEGHREAARHTQRQGRPSSLSLSAGFPAGIPRRRRPRRAA